MNSFKSDNFKLVVVMVGLPARGKTYIAMRISKYLGWLGYLTKVFNVGMYRRELAGAQQPHSFFDNTNKEALVLRKEASLKGIHFISGRLLGLALEDLIHWFDSSDQNRIAIYDATNSTKERRKIINERCLKHRIEVMFVESICDDETIIMDTIKQVKLGSPDYLNTTDPIASALDFQNRIQHYKDTYETITEDELENIDYKMFNRGNHSRQSSRSSIRSSLDAKPGLGFVKLINVGEQAIVSQIHGYIQSRIVYYLMNLHITPRVIYMCRHGESMFNVSGKIGGDADLSPRGLEFAKALPAFMSKILQESTSPSATAPSSPVIDPATNSHTFSHPIKETPAITVWTSTLRRTIQTAENLPYPKLAWKALDEIDAGVCDGLTYDEIAEKFPQDFDEREKDKLNYRYRGGESYKDLVLRLEPIIMELERQRNIMIIGHQAVLRGIYAYFLNLPLAEMPFVNIPLHTIIKLTPRAHVCEVETFSVGIEAVNTHRPKVSSASLKDVSLPKDEGGV